MESCDATISKSKVPHDPGWNDPPTFAYNSQQTTPNKPRNFLNKRVAFPLQGGSVSVTPAAHVNLPPTPSIIPPPVLQNTMINSTTEDVKIDSESTLLEVTDVLQRLLVSSDLGSKTDGIKKKLNIMEDMWKNGKLNYKVQKQIKDLVDALQNDKTTLADDIHKSLMVDHVSEVCMWMPGIKQLIYHLAARSELLAIDHE